MSVNKKIILGEILDNVYAAYYEDDVLKRIVAGPNDLGGEADDFVKEYGKNGLENFKRAISLSSGKLNQLTGQLQKAKGILEMLNLGEEK